MTGSSVTLTFGGVQNTGTRDIQLILRGVLECKDGTVYEMHTYTYTNSLSVGYYINPSISLSFNYPEGVTPGFGDQFVVYYKKGPDGPFAPIQCPTDGARLQKWPVVPVAFIATNESYTVGDYFTFALKNNNYLYAGSLWTIIDPDGVAFQSMLQSEREFQLTKTGTYKIKVDVWPDETSWASSSGPVETLVTYITVGE